MLSVRSHGRRGRAPRESGFTLIEMVVAISCAMVVMFALTTLMIVTMHQSQATFTRIDATRQARTALATIENELHSACVNGSPPIQGMTGGGTTESDANDLVFVSYYGTSDTPQAVWHHITYSPTAHTLVDTSQNATYVSSSTGAYWSPSGTATPVTLLTNVWPQGSTPVFQYFAYQHYANGAGTYWYWTVPDGTTSNPVTGAALAAAPLDPGAALTAVDGQSTVEVTINMLVGPTSENLNNLSTTALSTLGDPVTDMISLRLTTPPDYTPAGASATSYGPCQ